MTRKDLDLLVRGVAPALARYVGNALEGVVTRVRALEERAPVPGPAGPPGAPGDPGRAGADGAPGATGPAGAPGDPGAPGLVGPVGPPGRDGAEGAPGRDGRDGLPGVPGLAGEKGLDGRHGRDGVDGQDGRDGVGFDDLAAVTFDVDRRSFVFGLRRGEAVKTFDVPVPMLLFRDVYTEGRQYLEGDVVTWGGAMWFAKRATVSKPGYNDVQKDWQLVVKRGGDGKTGAPGAAGPKGDKGEKGDPGRYGH